MDKKDITSFKKTQVYRISDSNLCVINLPRCETFTILIAHLNIEREMKINMI